MINAIEFIKPFVIKDYMLIPLIKYDKPSVFRFVLLLIFACHYATVTGQYTVDKYYPGVTIDSLWISGGEPFLRERFVDIIDTFYKNNGITTINLPTNGLLTSRIGEWTGEILKRCPDLVIHLNFSIDGFASVHDKIRGVKGGFKKVMKSMELIEQ